MALYAADGSINVTVVDGTSITGLYAADGSWNVVVSDGVNFAGVYHPCGAYNVTVLTEGPEGIFATDGSLFVQEAPYTYTGGLRVTAVSGSLALLDALTLAWSTAASDNTPGFEVSGTSLDVAPVGAQIEIQVSTDVNFTPPPADTELSAVTGNPTTVAVSPALSDGQYWARARLLDSGDAPLTDWSNVVTETIVTASASATYHYLMFG